MQERGSLRRFGGGPEPSVRLVCFPWCGAGASVYRRFAAGLPDHIELLSVQLPGREDRFGESRLRSMTHIVEHMMEDLLPLCDRTLVLFGHSMGALVAYETVLALRGRIGREPDLLIVSGHDAPAGRSDREQRWHIAGEEAFIENLRRLGGTPAEILADREMMRALMPMLRADYEALETYAPQPALPLSCPLFVCAGEDDGEISRDGINAWRGHASGKCHVQWFDGDHFYLHSQPRVLTRQFAAWIAELGCSET
jgi:surfactin synthase thioesterase subunit